MVEMESSAAEKTLLLDLYVVSVEQKSLEPSFRELIDRTKLPELVQKLLLRRLAMSGHVIATRLTPAGKVFVESAFSNHQMVMEMKAFSEAFLLDLIEHFEKHNLKEMVMEDFPLYQRLPAFFFEFQLEVMEARSLIKRTKNGAIQLGTELKTNRQN